MLTMKQILKVRRGMNQCDTHGPRSRVETAKELEGVTIDLDPSEKPLLSYRLETTEDGEDVKIVVE